MCLHNESEAKRVEGDLRKSKNGLYKDHAVVVMRHVATELFAAGWVAEVTDPQSIANSIRDLKHWHEHEDLRADLTYVNHLRAQRGLETLGTNGLPAATGKAHRGYGYEKTNSETPELERLKRNIRSYMKRQHNQRVSA